MHWCLTPVFVLPEVWHMATYSVPHLPVMCMESVHSICQDMNMPLKMITWDQGAICNRGRKKFGCTSSYLSLTHSYVLICCAKLAWKTLDFFRALMPIAIKAFVCLQDDYSSLYLSVVPNALWSLYLKVFWIYSAYLPLMLYRDYMLCQ